MLRLNTRVPAISCACSCQVVTHNLCTPKSRDDKIITRNTRTNHTQAGAAIANVMDGSDFLELDPSAAWRRRGLEALRLAGPNADLGVQVGVDPCVHYASIRR